MSRLGLLIGSLIKKIEFKAFPNQSGNPTKPLLPSELRSKKISNNIVERGISQSTSPILNLMGLCQFMKDKVRFKKYDLRRLGKCKRIGL